MQDKLDNCSLCQEGFTWKTQLHHHAIEHTKNKPCNCPTCDKALGQMSCLEYQKDINNGEKLYNCSFCLKIFTQSADFESHMTLHLGDRPLYNRALRQRVDYDFHLKTHCEEKLCKSELCEDIESNMTQGWHGNSSCERLNINKKCTDERVLLTTEIIQYLSSRQSVESRLIDVEKRHSGGNSKFCADKGHLILRPYGCGMCDEVFQVEEEFVLHCSYHCSDDPEKEIFLELFNPFILNPYGCGKCGEMFEIDEEFMEHCYNHYYDDPEEDIFP